MSALKRCPKNMRLPLPLSRLLLLPTTSSWQKSMQFLLVYNPYYRRNASVGSVWYTSWNEFLTNTRRSFCKKQASVTFLFPRPPSVIWVQYGYKFGFSCFSLSVIVAATAMASIVDVNAASIIFASLRHLSAGCLAVNVTHFSDLHQDGQILWNHTMTIDLTFFFLGRSFFAV